MSSSSSSPSKAAELDMSSALAAFEAEIGSLDIPAPPSQSKPASSPTTTTTTRRKPSASLAESSSWQNVRHRAFISEPARKPAASAAPITAPSGTSTPSSTSASAGAASGAGSAPHAHTYSSAYGQEMQAKYDELQSLAKQFQNQRTGSYAKQRKEKFIRSAAGKQWEDDSLMEWPENDFRLFCGDLGNEVTDELLTKTFSKFPSFAKARVVRDKRTRKTKGFGFVSFLDANDYSNAFREFNGQYIGNRPVKLRKSKWTDRNVKK